MNALGPDAAKNVGLLVMQMWFSRAGPCMDQHHINQTTTGLFVTLKDLGHRKQFTIGPVVAFHLKNIIVDRPGPHSVHTLIIMPAMPVVTRSGPHLFVEKDR